MLTHEKDNFSDDRRNTMNFGQLLLENSPGFKHEGSIRWPTEGGFSNAKEEKDHTSGKDNKDVDGLSTSINDEYV
jgi:hypothetical protein